MDRQPPSTAEALRSALADLKPEGNYTLLNDALFTAARQLENGGIILFLTDGRDENSATTVEDVADLCRANHVRIIAIGTGRRVDEKAMRRLALLTDGASVGHADTIVRWRDRPGRFLEPHRPDGPPAGSSRRSVQE